MATKKPVAKKSAASKTSASSKKATNTKKRVSAKVLYKERYPERHQATGKYKFFFILFACTTLLFAALTVELFVFSTELQNKYESIDACARTHKKCSVTSEGETYKVEGDK